MISSKHVISFHKDLHNAVYNGVAPLCAYGGVMSRAYTSFIYGLSCIEKLPKGSHIQIVRFK